MSDLIKLPRAEFDQLARDKQFSVGPFMSDCGDGPFDPYVPPRNRRVKGTLNDGREVWADEK